MITSRSLDGIVRDLTDGGYIVTKQSFNALAQSATLYLKGGACVICDTEDTTVWVAGAYRQCLQVQDYFKKIYRGSSWTRFWAKRHNWFRRSAPICPPRITLPAPDEVPV